MKTRIVSPIVLAAAVAIGVSGCNFISPQATTYRYDASDGVSGNTGSLAIRNAIFIAGEDEGVFNLIFSVVNTSDRDEKLNVQLEFEGEKFNRSTTLAPGLTRLGGPDEEKIVFEGVDLALGSIALTYFQTGDESGTQLNVPVLDGELQDYKPFVLPEGFVPDENLGGTPTEAPETNPAPTN
ncbi:hypothetical protein [Lysinibacter sp. HNR]|uniref:hypothetical protein n=1 Tax=Lysinibacter sp. HNR TaxID=3031408 RepID=UPI002434EF2D|nr:hypothetical protein [Lysinibacter sp. HNR]WGD38127.1 hypothetical protein FrondiHNR_04195 [Lysinibacter sp. HNR]